jgi:hypothetical protein
MLKKDSLKLGILLGFVGPIIGVIIYYFAAFYSHKIAFTEYLWLLKKYKTALTGVSTLSLVANAVLFTLYINSGKDNTAKGIFVSTLVYGISILIAKLVS